MLVLDSSALFAMQDLPEEDFVVPPGVIRELRRHDDKRLDLWEPLLNVSTPTQESTSKVMGAAVTSGDSGRLSDVDISVLALALDCGGRILTDDYSIQNVATIMGIEYSPVGMGGIKKVVKWNYRCLGCGRWYKEDLKECPICGAGLRSHRKR